jgi:hypothetical protein
MTRLAAWLRQLRLPWQPGLVNPPKGTLVGRRRIATTHRAKTFMVSAAARTLFAIEWQMQRPPAVVEIAELPKVVNSRGFGTSRESHIVILWCQ